ncbi:hypothetical protein [Mucilaginibacter phyllosphaerae]
MYRGFQLKREAVISTTYKAAGELIHNRFRQQIRPVLDHFILENGNLDGSKMQSEWFPDLKADIFISHSHADKEQAMELAGWLYNKFQLTAFIDSCVWGEADQLIRQLDGKYSIPLGETSYNYNRRNQSTAHVHMMLNNALSKMIDSCECLFFLETPNSTVETIVKNKTSSPWIYSEISLSRIVRKKVPARATTSLLLKAFSGKATLNEMQLEQIRVEYLLELDHLQALTGADMRKWEYAISALHLPRVGNALDRLYDIKPIKKS